VPIILSLRDPRDACLSMSQRFAAPLQHNAQWLANDCQRVARFADQGHPLLRSEDRSFEESGSVDRLPALLGIGREARQVKQDIFARCRPQAVRCFARQLDDPPPERLIMVGNYKMDCITQVLASHNGDARTGKWRDLPTHVQTGIDPVVPALFGTLGYEA
jgi:hypothetical protein